MAPGHSGLQLYIEATPPGSPYFPAFLGEPITIVADADLL